MPYISFNLDWPPSARRVWQEVWCVLEGHDFEAVGERVQKSTGIEALLVLGGEYRYRVDRCKRCGHYRERYVPRIPHGTHSRIETPRMQSSFITEDTNGRRADSGGRGTDAGGVDQGAERHE